MTRKILLLTIFANLYSREKDLSLSDEEIDRQMASRREDILNLLRQEEAQIDAITGRESRDGGLDHNV